MRKKKTFKLKETYSSWDIRRAADICRLSVLQRTVLERIADYAQSERCLTSMDQNIYPRYSDLADRIGSLRGGENISHCTISRIVSRLSVLGYLIVVASPRGNRFFIPQSLFLRAYLQSNPADEMVRSHLAAELKRVREITRTNPKRFGGRKGQDLKKIRTRMTDLARAVKEVGGSEKSDLAELGNVVDIFCKTSSEKLSKISFIQKSDLAISDGRTLQLAMVGPCNNDRSIEPTLRQTTLSRTDIYIPTSKSIDSVENTATAKVGMDVFVKHDVFGRYARVFRQQLASKAEIEKFYAEYLRRADVSFSAILRNLEIFETVPAMQTSSCAGGYSKLNRMLSLKVEDAATGKRKDLGAKHGFWDKVPSRTVVAKIALDKGWSPELTHQWLLEKPADESFLNLVKSIAAERAEAIRVVEDERARKQAEHEAMEARLSGESEEYRQLAARLQEQNSYRVFPGCDWVKDFITKATFAQLSAAVEDGGRFEDKKEIPGDQAEQTGDASGTGAAEAPAETGEENQPIPEAINPAPEEPTDFGWEPEYDDDCPTAGELNAVFCDQPQGGIPEEPTEAPEPSGDTQTPPVTPTTTEKAPMGSEAEAPGSVEPPSTITHEEKEMADFPAEDSGQSESSADEFQERARALLDRAANLTGPARQKIWDQAMALRKERDEAKKQAKTGAPPPALSTEKQGPDTTSGVGEQSATQAKKVQQFSVNDPSGFDMPEFVSDPLPEEMGRGQTNHGTTGLKKATTFSDAALDDFIFGDSVENALESGIWLDKKGVPSPAKTESTLGAKDGTVADDISNEQEVQPHAADSSHGAEIPENLNSSPSAKQDGEQRDVQPEQSSTEFDAQLDEFILAGLGETEPRAGLSGSGSEKIGNDIHESDLLAADSTTDSTVVEKQRPDTSNGSGLINEQKNLSYSMSVGTIYVSNRANVSESDSKTVDREKQRPEAAIDSGLALYLRELNSKADSNISESAGQGWGYTEEENQRPEAQIESGPGSCAKTELLPSGSAENDESVKKDSQRTKNTAVNNKEPVPVSDSGSIRIFQGDITTPVSTKDSGFSPEQAISLALGTAGPPADQKKSVAGRKNIPALQNADPAQEKSVSAGKKKNSGNVAVRDSGKRELTPPSTESTDGGNVSATTPEQINTRRNSEEVGLLPGETVDEYVKRACRVCFRGKLAQQLQTSERIRKLPSDSEKLSEARQLLMGIQKPKTAA